MDSQCRRRLQQKTKTKKAMRRSSFQTSTSVGRHPRPDLPLGHATAAHQIEGAVNADGRGTRFGLLHVDYATQKRTPKLSAAFYREVAAGNRTN
jgi:hypothetical protein